MYPKTQQKKNVVFLSVFMEHHGKKVGYQLQKRHPGAFLRMFKGWFEGKPSNAGFHF